MKLINKTDIPDGEIREVIQFCKPNGIGLFDVHIGYSENGTHGNAAPDHVTVRRSDGAVLGEHRRRVKIWLFKDWQKQVFPYIRDANQRYEMDHGYLPILVLDEEEELYELMAHELRHLWQYQHRNSKRGWYPNNPYRRNSRPAKEYDASCYARTMVRKARRLLPRTDRINLLPFLFPMIAETTKPIYPESKPMPVMAVIADKVPKPAHKKSDSAPESYRVQKVVTFFRCLRCGKEWLPRFPDKEPTVCKFCKNPYWNKPRRQ